MDKFKKILKRVEASLLWQHRRSRYFVWGALVLFAAIVVLTMLKAHPDEGRVIVGYTPFDRRLANDWWQFYQIPLASLVVLSINFFLANRFFAQDKLISYILLASTLIAETLTIIVLINYLIYL